MSDGMMTYRQRVDKCRNLFPFAWADVPFYLPPVENLSHELFSHIEHNKSYYKALNREINKDVDQLKLSNKKLDKAFEKGEISYKDFLVAKNNNYKKINELKNKIA